LLRVLRATALAWFVASGAWPQSRSIDFNRDVRPILSDRCYKCHGPDESKRASKLRLDNESGAKLDLGKRAAVVAGDPANSELIKRVSSADKSRRMPPAWSGLPPLSGQEVETLTRWIAQGAVWQTHWSFLPPVRAKLHTVNDNHWPNNAIDNFILARLDAEGLKPSPEAERTTLIRRVSFDLTGLPPSIAEVDEFVNDRSPHAWERVVDRLLASPRFGERMASRWLDAARYADTNGYQTDGERSMWRWRDWVIDAFNRNMPFDKFTVDQLAGDLLPGATLDQIVATGFNRNHRGNGEGGIIPAEYAVEYVVDRVETTSAVWLGLTLGCARCHDHKYDPFKQKEFYQLFAYFNNVPERGKAFKYGNSPPLTAAPLPKQQDELRALDERLDLSRRQLLAQEQEIASAQSRWEKQIKNSAAVNWAPSRRLAVSLSFDHETQGDFYRDPPKSDKYTYLMENGPVTPDLPVPVELKPAWKQGTGRYVPGRFGSAASFDGAGYVEVGNIADFGFFDAFTVAAWIYPTADTGAIVSRAQDEPEGQGYGLYLNNGHLQANMIQRWLDDGARVETETTVPINQWSHVALSYDGSRMAHGIRIFINGAPVSVKIHLDDLNQSFGVKQPLRIGAGLGEKNRFHGLIDEVRIYRASLTAEDAAILAVPEPLDAIARINPSKRSASQAQKIRAAFVDRQPAAGFHTVRERILDFEEERERLLASFPTVMIMRESATPRPTHILVRGAYDHPGDQVSPAVPAVLPPLPPDAPNNRLGLAKWIVDPANPLPARVMVNRFWQMYFGTGLVKTVEDFGSQGEPPSHPELLDWLATEFVRTGWDVKALQKVIVMSAAYRQSSKVTPELLQKDPENRLLARGPRLRLSAEMLRDQALAVSGLLVEKLGGPSVKPYQPAGLWKELAGGEDYKPDSGAGLHRRSLYTFWKRTAPPPMMMNFDASGREMCTVREVRTNTPLQSLNLMNDVTYLEAARLLAERSIREGGERPEQRISFAFRLATARPPKVRERDILLSSLNHYRDRFHSDPASAVKYLNQGDASRDQRIDAADLAAYTTVASLILNLDATVTKE
jgi:hypothetical protein